MSIIVNNLSKSFLSGTQAKDVLKGISLEVKPGEILAILGPNGAGKTTLLKILSTLIIPDSGDAFITGRSILKDPEGVRKSLCLVHDTERSFYQVLSIEENLLFFSRLSGISKKTYISRAMPIIEKYGLKDWLDTKVSHCSSGIRQKAAIVRAMLADPKVLLIDEPTRSLDENSRQEIGMHIKDYVSTYNRSCIIVTHDIDEAKKISTSIGYLKEGSITLAS